MMEFAEIISRWKEFGTIGVVILILAKLGDKVFVWVLKKLDVNTQRAQTREDKLAVDVEALKVKSAEQDRRLTRVEGAYDSVHGVAHRSANGIEEQLVKLGLELPTVMFYVDMLRTVRSMEEVLKS